MREEKKELSILQAAAFLNRPCAAKRVRNDVKNEKGVAYLGVENRGSVQVVL